MGDIAARVGQSLARRGDAALAAILVMWVLVYQAVAGTGGGQKVIALAFGLVYAGALATRRRWPFGAAVATSVALLTVHWLRLDQTVSNSLAIFSWTPFLLAYALGTEASTAAGLAGVVLLAIALQTGSSGFNPFLEMITFGPWVAGRIILSRRHLTDQIEARNLELQAERERFALESVRYERARIARELHDIVAHCVTVMVVQASAGQRLPDTDHDGTAEALTCIAGAASQAQTEIGRLAGLLGTEPAQAAPIGLQTIGELVQRASLAGLAVNCSFPSGCDELAPAASEAVYRVVQEALTNALKHAPGARADITIRGAGGAMEVNITNTAPQQRPSGLERSGGGHGLAGMRDRVLACGGTFTAGPTPAGGWEVSALLPSTSPGPA